VGIACYTGLGGPAGTPLHLRLTSASVMNSFFVPQLGSQIYTMGGMTTTLHLQADQPGTYAGLSANFSGAGFSDMRFEAVALPPAQFDQWLAGVRGGAQPLDAAHYAELARPAIAATPASYSRVDPRLFERILSETAGASARPMAMSATGG
jgi:cytochrome o ubiquinol oxidase subunit II